MATTKGLALDALATGFLRCLVSFANASGGLLVSRRGTVLGRVCQAGADLPPRLPPLLLAEALHGHVVAVADARASFLSGDDSFADRAVSFLCAPVTWGGRVQAMLYLERDARQPFGKAEATELLDAAGRAGFAWPSDEDEIELAEELPPLFVLLAEDNEINRKVARAFLERSGHSVTTCVDGGEAVAAVEGGNFDVVLMDIRMPGLDGIEATRRIRALADPRKARIPILALTANFSPAEVERYLAVGMNAVVQKPLRKGAIEEALGPLFAVAGAPPPAGSPLAELPLLDDVRIGLLAEAMDAPRMIELCAAARASIAETAEELARHWQAGNAVGAARSAHRLCGVAANFGCSALAGLSAAIENDCRAGGDGRRWAASFHPLVEASLAALSREN